MLDASPYPNKRPRLSSPSYDDFTDDWDAEELKAIDQLEFSLSQIPPKSSVRSSPRSPQDSRQASRKRRLQAIADALKDLKDDANSDESFQDAAISIDLSRPMLGSGDVVSRDEVVLLNSKIELGEPNPHTASR